MIKVTPGIPTILGVVFVHVVWGILLLVSPDPVGTTPLSLIADIVPHHSAQGILLLSVSGLTIAGLICRLSLWIFAPQQIVLMISLIGPILAVMNGHYADLEPRPRIFIFADQLPAMMMVVAYSAGLWIKVRWENGKFRV